MTDIRAVNAYTATRPVTQVAAPKAAQTNDRTQSRTSDAAPASTHGPAVKVTLSPDATKALQAHQKEAAAKTAEAAARSAEVRAQSQVQTQRRDTATTTRT